MGKYKIRVRAVLVKEFEYTLYASSRDEAIDLMSTTNFDFDDFDEETFKSFEIEKVLDVRQIE